MDFLDRLKGKRRFLNDGRDLIGVFNFLPTHAAAYLFIYFFIPVKYVEEIKLKVGRAKMKWRYEEVER